ncbi:MAG: FAD-dependent oxidoreductase [Pseudohongiellaceae bacterium]
MTDRILRNDIVILGGGIAGLWLLNRLRDAGHDAVLLEKDELGGGQTLASQGIIHGGLKYALNGVLTPAASAIAAMPARWKACLEGRGDIDLRSCEVLSSHYWMWSGGDIRSRFKTFLGSRALHGRIDYLKPEEHPDILRASTVSGSVYRLSDFVVDTPSLLETLTHPQQDHIGRAGDIRLHSHDGQRVESVTATGSHGQPVTLYARYYILAAGAGNAELLQQIGMDQPAMQQRPLHMVTVRCDRPAWLHVIGSDFGMTPRLTITAHPAPNGQWTWYLGGELAERGVARDSAAQIEAARCELRELFPAVKVDEDSWFSFKADRAEPASPDQRRPDDAFVHVNGNVVTTWPTKLTLTPNLGDAVLSRVTPGVPRSAAERASEQDHAGHTLSEYFETPRIARPPWESSP